MPRLVHLPFADARGRQVFDLSLRVLDHWVWGANGTTQAMVEEWAAREKVEVQIDYITGMGDKLLLTQQAEAQAKSGHDIMTFTTGRPADHGNQLVIVADNIRVLAPIYFSAMLEELKFFQVVDKLVELAGRGLLPIGGGSTAALLDRYRRNRGNRISHAERRSLYARCLGIPGGDDGGTPNTSFNTLFAAFVSAVASFTRRSSAAQEVQSAARDLATNLSRSGDGLARRVAPQLREQISDALKILSSPEITAALRARDAWQVIDRVAARELGGARNSAKYRALASAGRVIIAWLAANSSKIFAPGCVPLIDLGQVSQPPPRLVGSAEPTDVDLVTACEQWIEAAAMDGPGVG